MKTFSAQPTQHERIVPPGEILVSRTDPRGVITYANSVFAGVSGYGEDELIGRSHNLVRHPDVPAVVFAEMWQTLKRGRMWHGILKNRCKNGDHYWVDALILPVVEDRKTIGYLSVRRQAQRGEIEAAQRHFLALRERPAHAAVPRKFRLDRYLSIRSGVTLGIVFVTLLLLLGAALGLGTIAQAERELGAMQREKVEAGDALGRIKFLMADNRAQIMIAALHDPQNPLSALHDHPQVRHLGAIEENRREIDRLWQAFRLRAVPGSVTALADAYWTARVRYVEDGLLPASRALAAGDFAAANGLIVSRVNPLYDAANHRADALAAQMLSESGQRYSAERALHERVQQVVIAGILGAIALMIVSGWLFFRGVVGPVEARIRDLERMAEGHLDAHVDVHGHGEIGALNRAFAATQAKLQYLLDNTFRGATQLSAESAQLKGLVLRIGDGIEDQHERVFRVLDRIKECAAGIAGLSQQADALLAAADGAAADADCAAHARALATSIRILAFTGDEMDREMERVAEFLVDDREAMHAMWTAATHLAQTATSLEKAAGYFEIG